MKNTALVYCEGNFGLMDGKTANGLVRVSLKYEIKGIIDSTKAGMDAGEVLDGKHNGIPIFSGLTEALDCLTEIPAYFIYGMAPLSAFLTLEEDRDVFFKAMEQGMNVINPLYELLSEDDEFVQKAKQYGVKIIDIRRTPPRKTLHNFTGRIFDLKVPVICVLGTDSAVGKRTTAILLVQALRERGLRVAFIATGQTGLLQGAKYGIPLDAMPSQYAIGEVENQILKAYNEEKPDIIIVEGQGSISHPAYISSCIIVRGARPQGIIVQHPPKRLHLGDFNSMPMPSLESEIEIIETFSKSKVIAITLNHQNMSNLEITDTICQYEARYHLPVTDVLKFGCEKLVTCIFDMFPFLKHRIKKI